MIKRCTVHYLRCLLFTYYYINVFKFSIYFQESPETSRKPVRITTPHNQKKNGLIRFFIRVQTLQKKLINLRSCKVIVLIISTIKLVCRSISNACVLYCKLVYFMLIYGQVDPLDQNRFSARLKNHVQNRITDNFLRILK